MIQYNEAIRSILENGISKEDRTGTGTFSIFGMQMRFDLKKGFPAVTTKKLQYESMEAELAWLLRGGTNVNDITRADGKHVKIWDAWADKDGKLGPVYGAQWRGWRKWHNGIEKKLYAWEPKKIDQIANVIDQLTNNPDDRRIIVSAWNVGELDEMRLPPCHAFFQFWTREIDGERYLSCQLYQRSCDMFLGVPFNIASYSLLTHIIANQVGMVADEFIWTGGDCHIYNNHIEQVREQLSREPYDLPTLRFTRSPITVDDFKAGDSYLENYRHHAPIKAEISV